jgi:uncharacterized membrane protein YsdA (DUF1294 family)
MELINLNIKSLNPKDIVLAYILIINLITFISFGIDKRRSRKNRWRIPESTLLGLSLIGGSLGGLIGMYFFRHKTKKKKFTLGMPMLLGLNTYAIFSIYGALHI